MLKTVQKLASVCVPNLPEMRDGLVRLCATEKDKTYAVKSADAVAALEASGLSLACQTAPLWPMNVPILQASLLAHLSTPCARQINMVIPIASDTIPEHWIPICINSQYSSNSIWSQSNKLARVG